MAYPNPSNALFAMLWEDSPGVPRRTGRADMEFNGETLSNNALTVARTAITRAAMATRPMPGKLEAGGELRLDAFNPAADWRIIAAYFGHATTDEVETGAFEHKFSRYETDVDFPETFTALVWRDDIAQRFLGCRISQIVLTIQEKALVGCVATLVPERGDYWGDATRSAGAGTGFPLVRGLLDSQFGTDTAANASFDIVSFTSTTVTFKAKIGDAATFDGAEQTATRGQWTRFADQDDVLLGTLGMPVQVYFPVGAVFAADDVLTVPRRRAEWTPSFPLSIAVNEVYSVLSIGSTEQEMDSLTLTIAMPTEARFGVGGQAARRTRQRGQQTVTGQFSREALNLEMRRNLEMGLPFSLSVYLRTGVSIGESGNLDYSLRLEAPSCVPSGQTPTVEDKDTYNEQISFTAHPSDDAEDPADISVYVINDVEDLAAA